MQTTEDLIKELSGLCGILPEYWDMGGTRHEASVETQKAILCALGINAGSEEVLAEEIKKRRRHPWESFLAPVTVLSCSARPLGVPVYLPLNPGEEEGISLSWTLTDENGNKYEGALLGNAAVITEERILEDEKRFVRILVPCESACEPGYYTLSVKAEHAAKGHNAKTAIKKTCRLIVAPDECYLPPTLAEGKTWGLSVNLYSVKSARNWGVGDFGDLRDLVRLLSKEGAGFVGINPLHAIPNRCPLGVSPYSPVSRLFKNFIYIDMTALPGAEKCKKLKNLITSKKFSSALNRLRAQEFINYERVASLKFEALGHAFEYFYKHDYLAGTSSGRNFRDFTENLDGELDAFAAYMALAEKIGCAFNWQAWPEKYKTNRSKTTEAFKAKNKKKIIFYKYIQWVIELQQAEIAKLAQASGMSVGLYHDLAIGSSGGGSDDWAHQDVIAFDVDVGAPPDGFNPKGQNWGFPPIKPESLIETGYEFLVQTLRRNMKHGGAIRIDHALGIFRLFWIPGGTEASAGAYVRYPSEDILRIIALESMRNKTIVIAEDLGTVGDDIKERLMSFKMLSYRLLYFERNYPDPSFRQPEAYPSMALCAVTTHDLPTLSGYWQGRDIMLRNKLGLYRDEDAMKADLLDREKIRKLLIEALNSKDIRMEETDEMTEELCLAVYEYLSKSPSKLLSVSLDDITGARDQQNMPGVTTAYPSWMRKTLLTVDELKSVSIVRRLSHIFEKDGRSKQTTKQDCRSTG
ncbi:MAG: 4-alpha-glucanotransferase [Nitrospirae bacterium]|nr:MAG: 4-alpha-glucanotransferase [Nitrospirota bacterium]